MVRGKEPGEDLGRLFQVEQQMRSSCSRDGLGKTAREQTSSTIPGEAGLSVVTILVKTEREQKCLFFVTLYPSFAV